jgi:hypothetical protein
MSFAKRVLALGVVVLASATLYAQNYVAVPGGPIFYPEFPPSGSAASLAFGSLLLDANAEKGAVVFEATKACNIDRIEVSTRTVTTGDTLDARIETVDLATGFPTGTLWATNSNGAMVIASADDNTWKASATLTAVATVARGDRVAVVLVHPNTANALNLGVLALSTSVPIFIAPYGLTDVGGAGYVATGQPLALGVHCDDSTFMYLGPNVWPITAIATGTAYGSGSTPDETGVRITSPFPIKVSGAWVHGDFDADADLVLYDVDGTTPLATVAIDKDVRFAVAAGGVHTVRFTSDITLAANSTYRLIVKPGAGTVALREVTVNNVANLDGFSGGQQIYYTARTDAGAWSDTNTKRVQMGLLISQMSDGTGGTTKGHIIGGSF